MASSALLKQIQSGTKLKRAVQINDRSAPQVDASSRRSNGTISSLNAPSSLAGPPQLAGLFAGGMPKLKPAGQSKFAIPPTIGKSPSIPNRSPAPTINELPSAPVPARLRLPSWGNAMGSSAPIPPRQAPPAIRSESLTSSVHPASLISRSTLAVPTFRNTSSPPTKAEVAIPGRAPPPPPKPSHAVVSSKTPLTSRRPPFASTFDGKPPVPRRKVPPPPPGFQ